jgi:hypothetical protein
MLAYDMSLLSPRKAFEYRWNVSANINGGIEGNIPDDNLVEINVKMLKELLRAQGPNVSYTSAKDACLSMQYIDTVKRNLIKSAGISKKTGKRTDVDKMFDVLSIAAEIVKSQKDSLVNEHEYHKDPVLRVTSTALHSWITEQKLIAAAVMQRT